MCVLRAECWKEQAADMLAAAQECTKQQYLLMLGVLLAVVVLGPIQTQSQGLRSGWHFEVLSRPVFCSCHTGGCDLDACLEILNRKKGESFFLII